MDKTNRILQFNTPATIGIMVSVFPFIFWTAVLLEIMFRNTFLMDNVISAVEHRSSFSSIVLLLILPGAAFVINFFFTFRFTLNKIEEEFRFIIAFKARFLNMAVLFFLAFNILLLLAYTVTENLVFFIRH